MNEISLSDQYKKMVAFLLAQSDIVEIEFDQKDDYEPQAGDIKTLIVRYIPKIRGQYDRSHKT